jgi:hypothetical protein
VGCKIKHNGRQKLPCALASTITLLVSNISQAMVQVSQTTSDHAWSENLLADCAYEIRMQCNPTGTIVSNSLSFRQWTPRGCRCKWNKSRYQHQNNAREFKIRRRRMFPRQQSKSDTFKATLQAIFHDQFIPELISHHPPQCGSCH